MRNSMLGVLGEDYIMTARAKGLSEQYILHRHALMNALLPIVTMTAMTVGFMVTGTIFVETVFAYPGIGNLLYNAVSYHDYPLLQGIFLFITIAIVGANLIADMIYIRLDPRVGHECSFCAVYRTARSAPDVQTDGASEFEPSPWDKRHRKRYFK
jgi:peptide/nickel transport system permease protein